MLFVDNLVTCALAVESPNQYPSNQFSDGLVSVNRALFVYTSRSPPDISWYVHTFYDGDMVQANGQSSGPNQCVFKNFAAEPTEPSVVNTSDDSADNIKFGGPDGWAVVGVNNTKRTDNVYLPRFGHIARRHQLLDANAQ